MQILRRTKTPSSKSLILTFVLFLTITICQIIGARIANSLALLSDSASMGVDSLSYLFNLYAECVPTTDERRKRLNHLICSGISLAILTAITIYFAVEASLDVVQHDETAVDPLIVIIFALVGILFDVIALMSLYRSSQKAAEGRSDKTKEINLLSAILHVCRRTHTHTHTRSCITTQSNMHTHCDIQIARTLHTHT